MFQYLSRLLKIPGIYLTIANSLARQKAFMRRTVERDIEQIKAINDGSLSKSDFKKITDYYSYAVPGILGEGYCMLRGRKLNERERYALTYYGGLTGLFDDFFDEKETSEAHIQELISHPREEIARNAHELLFIRFYLKGLEYTLDIEKIKQRVQEVHEIQLRSNKQKQPDISSKELEHITIEKGGVSLLFYRRLMDDTISEKELRMIYSLGGLMQVENDIFDVYKDLRDGILTFATSCHKIQQLRSYYSSYMSETLSLIHQTDFPGRNKRKFKNFITMVLCRGLVCLDCLEKNERVSGGEFRPRDYSKDELICDMEKLWNRLKTVHYYANW
jgi:hypothetical protein